MPNLSNSSFYAGGSACMLSGVTITNGAAATVPEPASVGILGAGIAARGAWRRRRGETGRG